MLETFSDGMGAWDFMNVLGMPAMKLPDALLTDLMTWKYIVGIIKRMKEEPKEDE